MLRYSRSDIVQCVWGATLLGSGGGGDLIDALNLAYAFPYDQQVLG